VGQFPVVKLLHIPQLWASFLREHLSPIDLFWFLIHVFLLPNPNNIDNFYFPISDYRDELTPRTSRQTRAHRPLQHVHIWSTRQVKEQSGERWWVPSRSHLHCPQGQSHPTSVQHTVHYTLRQSQSSDDRRGRVLLYQPGRRRSKMRTILAYLSICNYIYNYIYTVKNWFTLLSFYVSFDRDKICQKSILPWCNTKKLGFITNVFLRQTVKEM